MENKIALPTTHDFDIQYYTNRNKVYFGYPGSGSGKPRGEIKNADLATFELYVGWFAKDKNHCYFRGSVFKQADVKTFEVLNWAFAKDRHNVYTNKGILKEANPQTFEAMCDGYYKGFFIDPRGYGKDANHVFLYIYGTKTIKLKGADVDTFVHVVGLFGKDKNSVFWNGKKLKGANPKTWGLLKNDSAYSADDKNAYCGSDKIKGVDVDTFEIYIDKKNGNRFARDKNYIYNHDIAIGRSTPDWTFDTVEVKEFIKKMHPKYYAKWYEN